MAFFARRRNERPRFAGSTDGMIDEHAGGDEGALHQAIRGETEAVAWLVDRHAASVYRVALGALGDRREAEEVTRKVLADVIHHPGPYASASRVARVVAVVIRQRLRARRDHVRRDPDPLASAFDAFGRHAHPVLDWSGSVEDLATAEALADAVGPAVRSLPPTSRIALLLRDTEGMTEAETAAALGLPRAEVRSQVHRARMYVRAELAKLFSRP